MLTKTEIGESTTQQQSAITIDAFEELYTRYVGKVYKKCFSMTKDDKTAEDYTQDIFLKVFDKMESFQNRSTFSTWLYAISHNYCLDQLRIGKRFSTESLSGELINSLSEQDSLVLQEHRLLELEQLLNNLPDQEAYFLRLRYEEGLSIKEIARVHHLTESSVKMRLKRTRDKLYKRFAKPDPVLW
ncbi:RNA polymerase sigma factor [Spirosoma agri]|uniref:RNA polymerase sigma factor n=1 Tax=Spirosoma agri TaxID=1987381 RepID=A0A6M0IP52_9BACT|nr:RNA polymerase sigma factor [Spirosoma agri]NEU69712.1 RNA polymerase sigma factor [Spirosoma agri]